MGVRKEAEEEERDGKKRAGWTEKIDSKKKKKKKTPTDFQFVNFSTCGAKVLYACYLTPFYLCLVCAHAKIID